MQFIHHPFLDELYQPQSWQYRNQGEIKFPPSRSPGGGSGSDFASPVVMKNQLNHQFRRKKLSGDISPGLPETIPVLALKVPHPRKPLSLGQARMVWSSFLEEISFSSEIWSICKGWERETWVICFNQKYTSSGTQFEALVPPDIFLWAKTFVRPWGQAMTLGSGAWG